MSVAGLADLALEIFGGFVSPEEFDPQSLPPGASWDCQDVQFPQTGVRTRPGLTNVPLNFGGPSPLSNQVINYTKTYRDPLGNNRNLFLVANYLTGPSGASGRVLQEFPQGSIPPTAPYADVPVNLYCHSATAFGREYLAFHDGKFGAYKPLQFDGTNFDRVSQVGPGEDPTCVDVTPTVKNIVATPNGASQSGNIATIVTTAPHGFVIGDTVTVAGVDVGGYNVTAQILSVPTTTSFTYANSVTGLAAGGNGTATPAGNVTAGKHGIALIFVTRSGGMYISPGTTFWNAAGGNQAAVTLLHTGPANVVKRIVCFTAANGGNFYYMPDRMIVNDNTTVAATFDFTDAALTASTNVDQLFQQIELGECADVIFYANRLAWVGERNKMNNWTNLSFDGCSFNELLGWKKDNASFSGGSVGQPVAVTNPAGFAYGIFPQNPFLGTVCMITQGAVLDVYGVPRIRAGINYSVRVRLATVNVGGGFPPNGALHIDLAGTGVATTGLVVTVATMNALFGGFADYTAVLTAPLTLIPNDLELRVYMGGNTSNVGEIIVDDIEIYPTDQPYNSSLVRASRSGQPENYDGVTGIMLVEENNGQRITTALKIREQLYFVKERSLYVTQDDGVNEPNQWPVTEISNKVGSVSVEGAAVGEEWATLAAREGFYITGGGEPAKLCKEIQPDWDRINWQYGHTIWTKIDTRRRLILVGIPSGSAISPNKILTLSYRALDTWEEIASHAMVDFSARTGAKIAIGDARKWCPWNIAANCCGLIERNDGTAQIFLGNGAGTGKLYQLDDNATSDDGAAIDNWYTPYFFPSHQEEQGLQLGAHRKLFGYLSFQASGIGSLSLTARTPADIANPGVLSLPFPVAAINAASQTFYTVTITTASPHGFSAGQRVVVSGVTVPGYNATAQIIATPTPTTFTYDLLVTGLAASGGGTAQVILTPSATLLGPEVLSLAPQWDAERTINLAGERISFKMGTNAVGEWFWLKKFVVSVKRHPASPVRGT
jgi:hypothetical protein